MEAQALVTSLIVSGRALLFALPIAVALAYALARGRFHGRLALDALAYAPMALPPVVVGYLLLMTLGLRGPIGGLLFDMFGVRLAFTSAGASIATAVMTLPMMIRAVRLSLEAQDPGLDEAARTLGAGLWDRIVSLHLPLAWPGILAAAVIGFSAGLGEFGAVITFAANIPGQTQTLPMAIYSVMQMPDGDAAAARLAAISIALAFAGLLGAEAIARWSRRR
ncbi:MAG TPA: ABC transporter permease subunit [Caulobacterales bacterium]|nr:ABC transporter permease subunit [Caulobacterales bacterium]